MLRNFCVISNTVPLRWKIKSPIEGLASLDMTMNRSTNVISPTSKLQFCRCNRCFQLSVGNHDLENLVQEPCFRIFWDAICLICWKSASEMALDRAPVSIRQSIVKSSDSIRK